MIFTLPIVSQDVFLKVNDIQSKNPHGYKHNNEETNVPMKVFLKCGHCNRSLTGYVVKAKGIWYYKCKTIGCSNNKSAKELHQIFEFILSRFSLNPQLQDLIKRNLLDTIAELNKESEFAKNSLKEQIVEVSKKIERTEERYMEEEITQDLFTKYMTKYKAEKLNLLKEYNKMENNSSNHEILVENALEFACNLSKKWANGDFQTKTNLQYYLFPDGLSYSKVLNEVRTNKINPFFSWIALQQKVLDDKKSGIPELNIKYSAFVELQGFEPWSGVGNDNAFYMFSCN